MASKSEEGGGNSEPEEGSFVHIGGVGGEGKDNSSSGEGAGFSN